MPNLYATPTGGVYWIYQPAQDRAVYVGSSQNIERRMREHVSRLKNGKHCNPHLQAAWNKYGADAFQFLPLEECTIEQLAEREEFWMMALDPTCNISREPYAGMRGQTMSLAARQRMSAAGKGRPKSAEHRRKIGEAHRGRKIPGRVRGPMSEAQKQKLSEISRGHRHTEEHKRKLSEQMKGNQQLLGHVHSEETRRKMSEAHQGKKRKPLSEETKRKISQANKGQIPWNKRDA